MGDIAWYDENSENSTHAVGLKVSNDWGFYDMHGNVREWCADGLRDYSRSAITDPLGSRDHYTAILRGGSWLRPSKDVRAPHRLDWLDRIHRRGSTGFRPRVQGYSQEEDPSFLRHAERQETGSSPASVYQLNGELSIDLPKSDFRLWTDLESLDLAFGKSPIGLRPLDVTAMVFGQI